MTSIVWGDRPSEMRTRGVRHARLVAAGLLGAASVASTFVPALDAGARAWVPLALLAPVVLWCALPVHLKALRGVARGRLTSWMLASIGILAAFAWSAHAVATDREAAHLVPLALASVLVVVAQHVSELAGQDRPDDPAPVWLPPLVIVVAAAALAVWWFVDGSRAGASAGFSVLLAGGPAALLLAEPAALVGARRGGEIGLLAAGADAMRAAGRIDTIVLDKHGTVTTGELSVMAVEPVDPEHLRNLRWFAGALSHSSDHPIARAISKLAPRGRVSNVVTQPDIGISGSVDRHPVRIGIPGWIGIEDTPGLGTQVGVEVDERALGWITVGDTLRPDARRGIERLGAIGLEPILVSDRPEADTMHLADQAGIAAWHPRMTVDECATLVGHLQAQGRVVAMVGRDGSHAPALRSADLAISTSERVPATGIALADVDVRDVGDAIILLRQLLSTTLTNRRLAVIGMLVPMPWAAAGLIEPLYAPLFSLACMAMIAVSSSRLPRRKRPVVDRRS